MTKIQLQARNVFLAAIELPSLEARAEFVATQCQDDTELKAAVQRLLDSHRELGPFCESQDARCTAQRTALLEHGQQLIGTQIGPYKLREQIGEGGMGVVYVAEQNKPVKRKVALKLIKPGMASKDVVARFEAERQALAMMDHPNIAKVHDGGATDTGQPYFVMELVQGLPITDYFDEHKLSTNDRLQLFATVCRAVQHAHQKGIIHRDLKPSNILVSEIDDTAVPKVIDFGVAKAVSQTLTDETLYTHFSQIVGTPLYMSPEQTGLGVVDIDTRSDVYALGVLLYELLTGRTPFDSDTLKSAGFDEMRRIIREDEPPKPSAMVSTLNAEALSTISQRRGSDPRKLSDSLAGELDWLVMKALDKDRNRRYESAGALAADVEHYLLGDVIEACPPSVLYRFQKTFRRHRTSVLAASAVVAALLLGLIGTTVQMLRATDAEADAEAATASALAEAARANQEKDRAQRALEQVEEEAAIALRGLKAAFQLQRRLVGREHGDRLMLIARDLASYYETHGSYDEAVGVYDDLCQSMRDDYPDAHEMLAHCLYLRASVKRRLKRFDLALQDIDEAINASKHISLRHTLQYRFVRYLLLDDTNRHEEALHEIEAMIELKRELIAQQPNKDSFREELGILIGKRASTLARLKQYSQALQDFDQSLQLSPDNGEALTQLAQFLLLCENASYRDYPRALELTRKAAESEIVQTNGWFWSTRGLAEFRTGNHQQAIDCCRKGMDFYLFFPVRNRLLIAMSHQRLGNAAEAQKWIDGAKAWMQKPDWQEDVPPELLAEALQLFGQGVATPERAAHEDNLQSGETTVNSTSDHEAN